MQKQIYINLPVRDLEASTKFYEALGFVKNPMFSNEQASGLMWSDTIYLMILRHDFFGPFYPNKEIADAKKVVQVGLCVSMESREAVDAFAAKAVEQGGRSYSVEQNQQGDFMYGLSVEDLDGHVWEPMWMDAKAFQQQ